MSGVIPVSVLVMTRNEAGNIVRCLSALEDFSELIVVDSASDDKTVSLAKENGASVVNFEWNGAYPKKRQWCLDNLNLQHKWVLFIDADEVVTAQLCAEVKSLISNNCNGYAGFFVSGRYVVGKKMLRFGLHNKKIALLHKDRMHFPVIYDLGLSGMGEIEGHYQPVLKDECKHMKIGSLKTPLLHYAYADDWEGRHERYAEWERGMNARNAWPEDPVLWRQMLKKFFRKMPFRPHAAFLHCYVLKLGALDGMAGFKLARDRYRYYKMIYKPDQG